MEEHAKELAENTITTLDRHSSNFLVIDGRDNVGVDSANIAKEGAGLFTDENVESKDNNEIIQPVEILLKDRAEMVQPRNNGTLLILGFAFLVFRMCS